MTTDYSKIAKGFSRTRNVAWPCVQQFLNSMTMGQTLFENGCGNGRNLLYGRSCNLNVSGADICDEFVDICSKQGLLVYQWDILQPLIGVTYDAVLSIAVIHHLRTPQDRLTALKNCYDMVKPGGRLMISVWSMESEWNGLKARKPRDFEKGENLVPWKNLGGEIVQQRYYYVFNVQMFNEYINSFSELINEKPIINIFWEEQNWIAIIRKPVS